MNRQQPQPKANGACCAADDPTDEVVVGYGGGDIGKDQLQRRVYTRRVPKDRRVRLSATTAMQFFDLQERLGYSRPSRAIDWLIAKAQSAIDKLARPPPTAPPTAEMQTAGGDSFLVPNCTIHPRASPITFQGLAPGLVSESANSTEDLCLSLCTSEQTGPNRVSSPYRVAPSGASGFETNFGSGSGSGPSRFLGPVAPNNGVRYVFTAPPASSVGWSSFQSSLLPSRASLQGWDDLPIACCAAASFGSDGRVLVGQGGYGFGFEDKLATFSGPSGTGN